jgi:hypothetical protein
MSTIDGDAVFGPRTFRAGPGEFDCDAAGVTSSGRLDARRTRRSFRRLADGSIELHYWLYEESVAVLAGSGGVEDGYLRWRPAAGEQP